MTVFIKDALATVEKMNTNSIRSQKRIRRTGAKLFENDGERGCRYALVREIWVVPGDCGQERGTRLKIREIRVRAVLTVQTD